MTRLARNHRQLAAQTLAIWITLAAAPGHTAPTDPTLKQGQALYSAHCARCHGEDGADVTIYPNVKPLVNITRRLSASEVIDRSKGFVAVALEGQNAAALYAFLGTLQTPEYPRSELLVSTAWVAERLRSPEVRLVDMRAEAAYTAGHIPGAVRIEEGPLRSDADPLTQLPGPDAVKAMFEKAGISNNTHVVIYDDQGGRSAARLWYVLSAYGHERVSLVNGGWKRWVAEQRSTVTETPAPAAGQFRPRLTPTMTCPTPEVLARKPGVVLLDTRSPAEYRGEQASGGGKGRIPGAVNVDWRENVASDTLLFKPAAELKKLYEGKGLTPDKEIVTYCATGGRASHSLFTLKLLGYKNVKVYYGSFSDYTKRNAPVEK